MTDADRLRLRLTAAGATIPEDVLAVVAAMAGAMLTAHERLAELDLGEHEPFSPARRLPDDAG
jgi:hypothetical protein